MPPSDNCCCCCFTLKTGVTLIGILTWIVFIENLFLTIAYHDIWWYFLPTTILLFIAGIKWLTVSAAFGKPYDAKARLRFFYTYLFDVVILCNAWTLVYRIVWRNNFIFYICEGSEDCIEANRQINSVGVIVGMQLPYIFLDCYFCYVIKLYADKGKRE